MDTFLVFRSGTKDKDSDLGELAGSFDTLEATLAYVEKCTEWGFETEIYKKVTR